MFEKAKTILEFDNDTRKKILRQTIFSCVYLMAIYSHSVDVFVHRISCDINFQIMYSVCYYCVW